MNHYFIIHKPYQVLSQFTTTESKKTLADYFHVPKDVYAVGRLDYDSEGLLVLTNDTTLNQRLLSPQNRHEREYWVQVEGMITPQAMEELQSGIWITIDGKQYKTKPCNASVFAHEPLVSPRYPPIRYRQNIPATWISLTLTEGKNRQVRKMTAKAGFPTLRLIRYRIEGLTLDHIKPGGMEEVSQKTIYKSLFKTS